MIDPSVTVTVAATVAVAGTNPHTMTAACALSCVAVFDMLSMYLYSGLII